MSDNDCRNCIYYMPHYILSGFQYRAIDGHCLNTNLPFRTRHRLCLKGGCSFWEEKQKDIVSEAKSIKEIISLMQVRLDELLSILLNYID